MSSEAWALVGVVVGVVLSAVTQVVVERLGRKHERAMTLRTERREAYVEMLAAASESLGPFAASRFGFQALLDADVGGVDSDERVASVATRKEALTAGGEALHRLGVASSRVHLVAPPDTSAASDALQGAVMWFMFRDEEGMAERLAKAQQEFADLAKRDLALN